MSGQDLSKAVSLASTVVCCVLSFLFTMNRLVNWAYLIGNNELEGDHSVVL